VIGDYLLQLLRLFSTIKSENTIRGSPTCLILGHETSYSIRFRILITGYLATSQCPMSVVLGMAFIDKFIWYHLNIAQNQMHYPEAAPVSLCHTTMQRGTLSRSAPKNAWYDVRLWLGQAFRPATRKANDFRPALSLAQQSFPCSPAFEIYRTFEGETSFGIRSNPRAYSNINNTRKI
jgi:hypothetical protein